MTKLAEQLGAALRTVRSAVGMSQGDLATRIGTKQSYISEWESGRKLIPLPRLAAIEEALGLSRGTILGHAGFVGSGVNVRDLIAADPDLAPEDRTVFLRLYELARLRGPGRVAEGDSVADDSQNGSHLA